MPEASLPENALIDSGVFMRFLGDRPEDPDSDVCTRFCRKMLAEKRELFIAAPTLAELLRHRGQEIPRTPGITVVPFDERAAFFWVSRCHTRSSIRRPKRPD